MAKKKISKSRRRRIVILGGASIVAFVFFCINAFNYSYKIISLTNKQNELALRLEELKEEKERLDVDIEKYQDPEYIARYARQEYSYTKEGEYVIKIQKSEEELKETEKEINKMNHARVYIMSASLFAIVGLVIFVKIKKS